MKLIGGAYMVLAVASGVAGCSTTAPPPVPGSDAVRATTTLSDIAACSLLGKVIVSEASADPAKDARDQTATLGGNVLLRKNDLVWNGNAYECLASPH